MISLLCLSENLMLFYNKLALLILRPKKMLLLHLQSYQPVRIRFTIMHIVVENELIQISLSSKQIE